MTRKDLVAVYRRLGLTIAAFALVASIIASPLLPRFGSGAIAVSEPRDEPAFRALITPASLKAN